MKNCDELILAPDPDREGESIAWHIVEALKKKKVINQGTPVKRVVFNAITKNLIQEAINNPREIDMNLVNAQQSRRALDYLVGFTLSPILWRKLPGSKSAGRVQSVALRVICEREDEIEKFKSEEYWDIKVDLNNQDQKLLTASLTHVNDEKLEKFSIKNEKEANKIADLLRKKLYKVLDIKEKDVKRRPYPPFMTSTLQQEASRRLGFSTKKTMQVAQKLYEGLDIGGSTQGLITYMRTDGVDITPEAISKIRDFIRSEYGNKYLPEKPTIYKNKVKNSQEAHEAIRPTDPSLSPSKIKQYLQDDYFKLYDLIWKRTIASQMSNVVMKQVTVTIATKPEYGILKLTGSIIKFDGFYVLYELRNEKDKEEQGVIPDLQINEDLTLLEVKPNQHFTEPPPRYSEASLVKKMEELGIGRPSTYSSIITVLQDRQYVKLDKKRFTPEERGRIVTSFLKEFFTNYVEYDYTAKLEDDLDIISNGDLSWKSFLNNFWSNFNVNIEEVSKKTITEVLDKLNMNLGPHIFGVNEKGDVNNDCSSCSKGKLGIKVGKFGVFIGCSNYPECKHTQQISSSNEEKGNIDADVNKSNEPKIIGNHSKTGQEISLKKGPYGFYIELEPLKSDIETPDKDNKKDTKKSKKAKKPKPKRISVPKNMNIGDINLDQAEKLLSLPREIGKHPQTNLMIKASIGPFGPYLLHDGKYSSVKEDDILTIDLQRSIIVIKEDLEKNLKNLTENQKNKMNHSTAESLFKIPEFNGVLMLKKTLFNFDKAAFLCEIAPENPYYLKIIYYNNQFKDLFDIDGRDIVGNNYDFLFESTDSEYSDNHLQYMELLKSIKNFKFCSAQIDIKRFNKTNKYNIKFYPNNFKDDYSYAVFTFQKVSSISNDNSKKYLCKLY